MTSEEKFSKILLSLFSNYGQDPDADRLRFAKLAVSKSIGFDHDWDKVFLDLVVNEKFFPSVAVIVEYAKKIMPMDEQLNNRQKAELCVDRYIMFLNGNLNYEEISQYDHNYCKKRFNCDKHSVQSGNVNLNFKRKEWIDICELDFETHKRTGELPIMLEAKESVFPGLQMKTIEGSL